MKPTLPLRKLARLAAMTLGSVWLAWGQTPRPLPAPRPPIPPKQAMEMADLYSLGEPRSYLGVNIQDISGDRAQALKLKEDHGVEVTMVDQDSPAGKAGVKEHDVIVSFNGEAVEGEGQFRRLIRETPPGRSISLGISRDGQPLTLTVQLADRSKIFGGHANPFPYVMPELPEIPEIPEFDISVHMFPTRTGATVENLTRQLGDYFGVHKGEGVLVRSVERGSAAETAGLKAGDVIVRVQDEHIANRADWARALRGHSGKLSVTVVRDKKEVPLSLNLPAGREGSELRFRFPEDFQQQMERLQQRMEHLGPELQRAFQRYQQTMRDTQIKLQNSLKQREP